MPNTPSANGRFNTPMEPPPRQLSHAPASPYFESIRNRTSVGCSTAALGLAVLLILVNAATPPRLAIAIVFFVPAAVWFLGARSTRRVNHMANSRDFEVAEWLSQRIRETYVPVAAGDTELETITCGRVGEVSRHFDQSITAGIDGWMQHRLAPAGTGEGTSMGGVGLGTGTAVPAGSSQLNQTLSGTIRGQLMADSLMAVIEVGDAEAPDVLRFIVPSEQAVRELMSRAVGAGIARFQTGTHTRMAAEAFLADAVRTVPCDVSYVADLFHALLRMEPTTRPSVCVVGLLVTDHAMIGGAARIGESEMHQLLPLHFVPNMLTLLEAARGSSDRLCLTA